MFIDDLKIHVKAGKGGDGCSSLNKDRYHKYGVPDGGPGGKGGDIKFRADGNIATLLDFQFRQHFEGERGGHGSSNNKKGRSGEDMVLLVPPGTVIRDTREGFVLRDLTKAGDEVVVARGGRGGNGNSGGRMARKGSPGEARELRLELKVIADVGIVGYPNCGKSTLLSRISSARPKIANYPFTTKEPCLGVVKLYEDSAPFVVADIPGLIENAHKGRGLGDKFLRHIERTRILVHLVDISGFEGREPYKDYLDINKELKSYSRLLAGKTQIIALNKIDMAGAKKNIAAFKGRVKKRIYPISALTGEGVGELLKGVYEKLKE